MLQFKKMKFLLHEHILKLLIFLIYPKMYTFYNLSKTEFKSKARSSVQNILCCPKKSHFIY